MATSAQTPPTFILVPGHWHTPKHLKPLTTALDSLALPNTALQLHTVGQKPKGSPRPSYSDDVSVIYTAVTQRILAGTDVVLVLHSYAGMPGAEAVNCLIKDGVVDGVNIVRPDSGIAMPNQGQQADDSAQSPPEKRRMGRLLRVIFVAAYIFPAKTKIDPRSFVGPDNPGFSIDDKNNIHISSPWHYFFNDLPLSLAKPYVDACTSTYYVGPMSIASENWRRAKITAIVCTKDNAMPLKRQEGMWGWLEEDEDGMPRETEWAGRVERIQACHSPWVSRAREVAGLIGKGWVKGDEKGKEGR